MNIHILLFIFCMISFCYILMMLASNSKWSLEHYTNEIWSQQAINESNKLPISYNQYVAESIIWHIVAMPFLGGLFLMIYNELKEIIALANIDKQKEIVK